MVNDLPMTLEQVAIDNDQHSLVVGLLIVSSTLHNVPRAVYVANSNENERERGSFSDVLWFFVLIGMLVFMYWVVCITAPDYPTLETDNCTLFHNKSI